jgi:hypothetical protein
VSSAPTPVGDRVVVELPPGDGYRAVGRLVLGGLASRFELPVDRVEELLLALESVLVQGSAEDAVTLEMAAAEDALRIRVGPFTQPRLADPGVTRVLSRLVDEVGEVDDGGVWVELGVTAHWVTSAE